jgi:hypothetical protein
VALLSGVGHLLGRPSPDVAWNLYLARSLLSGARLGENIMENTPPMILGLKVPVVAWADVSGQGPWEAWVVLIMALAGIGALLLLAHLRGVPGLPPRSRVWLTAAIPITLVAVPGVDFGQRDHVTAILVLPYCALVARRLLGVSVATPIALVTGLLAAVGIGIKPHFVLLPMVLWGALARRHGLRVVLAPEHLTVLGVGLAYIAVVAVAFPAYVSYAMAYGPLYQRFRTEFVLLAPWFLSLPAWGQAALSPHAVAAYLGLGAFVALRGSLKAPERALAGTLALSTATLILAAVVQAKGWRYHYLPGTVLAILLICTVAACVPGRPLRALARVYLTASLAAALLMLAGELPNAGLRIITPQDRRLDADANLRQLLPLVAAVKPDGYVAILSTNIKSGFPLLLEGGRRWAFRHPSLWPMLAFYHEQVPGRRLIAVREASEREGLERRFTQEIVDDFLRMKPELLLVLRPDATSASWGGARRFDYLGYFSSHPTFREAILPVYTAKGRLGDYDVYLRRARADGR